MNNHEEAINNRPGLRCRLVRRWEAWRGPAAGHTALTARHMETCEECQAFFAEDFAFEEMLTTAARAEKRATAPQIGFEQRILRAVRESQPEMERESALTGQRSRGVSLAWSLAGAAAGVALALVVAQKVATEKTGPQVVTKTPVNVNETPVMPDANVAVDDVQTPPRWWESLNAGDSARVLTAKNPLQQEIESISTDAQSVLGFLALNFLPTETGSVKSRRDESRVNSAGQG
ncbi:MAG: hypothetical protein QM760_05960 [Nibricoccus sp.]